MPAFRFDKASGIAQSVKALLNQRKAAARKAVSDDELREKIRNKKQELLRIKQERHAAGGRAENIEYKKRKKRYNRRSSG